MARVRCNREKNAFAKSPGSHASVCMCPVCTVPGVAAFCSDLQMAASGPRVLIFGGQRQGIQGSMYSFEQSTGDGYALMPWAT